MGCYIWYSEEGPGRAAAPPSPLLAVPNVTSPPINGQCTNHCIAIDDGPLLCGFSVAIKGLLEVNFSSASLNVSQFSFACPTLRAALRIVIRWIAVTSAQPGLI